MAGYKQVLASNELAGSMWQVADGDTLLLS